MGVRNENLPIMRQAKTRSKELQTLHFFFFTTPQNSDYSVISTNPIRHYTHKRIRGTAWHLEDYPRFPTY